MKELKTKPTQAALRRKNRDVAICNDFRRFKSEGFKITHIVDGLADYYQLTPTRIRTILKTGGLICLK